MTEVGTYYVYYYAEGYYGFMGSDVGKVVATVSAVEITATVNFKETTMQFTGSQIELQGKQCYSITVPEGTTGFDPSKVFTSVLVSVQGTDPGTYYGPE